MIFKTSSSSFHYFYYEGVCMHICVCICIWICVRPLVYLGMGSGTSTLDTSTHTHTRASLMLSKWRVCLQCRRHRRHGFSPWIVMIPWSEIWQPTPVFLPEESHGQRSPIGYSSWGHKEVDMTKHARACAYMHTHTYTYIHIYIYIYTVLC